MEIIVLHQKTARLFYQQMLTKCHSCIRNPAYIALGAIDETTGTPLGALVALLENETIFIQSLYIDVNYRQQGIAKKLLSALKETANEKHCQKISIYYVLPKSEIAVFDHLLCQCDFQTPVYQGEIFCFNPYNIVSTKFTSKTLARGSAFLPEGWNAIRYNELTENIKQRLNDTEETIFPNYLSYKLHWETLDLPHSIILLNDTDIIGYLSQQRLAAHSVSVPCFAVNPNYRGAGLYLLKYYMYVVHFETPEIYEIRCHFTPKTITGWKLFEKYTENRYHRHSIEKTAELLLNY
ncbi:N-acetyltransferase [Sporomusa sp. KB1]|jgi:ribosomal protein S18 acetylase RimI-like enzyme|uniref:GNAT family N-acetyltransferase n=1 Tax=Sporomusa sp. KB1 TaxID=943346 RepID=UPI0011AD12B4|nr:GNAT family N-acetyltransferase [Sporomusa sp. KB1]TWH46396.1 acetyltransferase (GNAT) family protein [Sporomusa sp. KB1]